MFCTTLSIGFHSLNRLFMDSISRTTTELGTIVTAVNKAGFLSFWNLTFSKGQRRQVSKQIIYMIFDTGKFLEKKNIRERKESYGRMSRQFEMED